MRKNRVLKAQRIDWILRFVYLILILWIESQLYYNPEIFFNNNLSQRELNIGIIIFSIGSACIIFCLYMLSRTILFMKLEKTIYLANKKRQEFYFKRSFVLLHDGNFEKARVFYKALAYDPIYVTYLSGMSMGIIPDKPFGKNNYDQLIDIFNKQKS